MNEKIVGTVVQLDNLNIVPDYDTFILWMKLYSWLLLNILFGQMDMQNIFTKKA